MVKIRLMRMGAKKRPVYRVVVADARDRRDGRFIDIIGQYDPLPNPSLIAIDEGKALEWLSKGAQPTESTLALLKRSGIWSKHVAARPPKPQSSSRPRKSTAQA